MSKVEEKIKKYSEENNFRGMYFRNFLDELKVDLNEIRTEQEELQKKADKYDELSKSVEVKG